MISDPAAFFHQVIQQALSHTSADDTPHADSANPDNEKALIEILGNSLAAMFQQDRPPRSDQGADANRDLSPGERVNYQALLERNGTLALALGACDCWGELSDCNVCWGAGKPGWNLPDLHFFAQLVRPALKTIRETSVSLSRGARTKRQPTDDDR